MIYADTGIIMRLIEGTDRVRIPIESRLHKIDDEDCTIVTSRLSRLECRCRPLRDKQNDLLDLYESFFASREVALKEIDAAVVEKATIVRATQGLKTPDAIHAATAILSAASMFWTTDRGFCRCSELTVEVFDAV